MEKVYHADIQICRYIKKFGVKKENNKKFGVKKENNKNAKTLPQVNFSVPAI
jgi:hypothetical protein